MNIATFHHWFTILFMPLVYGCVIGMFLGKAGSLVQKHTAKTPFPVTYHKPTLVQWRYVRSILASQPLPKYMRSQIRVAILYSTASLLTLLHIPYSWPFGSDDLWLINHVFQVAASILSPAVLLVCAADLRRALLDYAYYTELDLGEDGRGALLATELSRQLDNQCSPAANEKPPARRL